MKAIASFVLFSALISASSSGAVTIDMVTVGNPGNAPDLRYNTADRPEGYGAVDHVYQIGKYEVTAGQYTEFLNAVADADPNGLYEPSIDFDALPSLFGANIKRSGSSPNFSYSVGADWADRPVNYVSFWDAARFANWLHNGQPTGAQGPGTTEDGAYHDVGSNTLFGRSAGAKFFIPTADEWYKAAYHDKAAGLSATYFDYPTATNAYPGNDITETTNPGSNANYIGSYWAIGPPYFRTVGGEFELSDSPYGTFDQAGNLWEWDESTGPNSSRGFRGGSFVSSGIPSALHREFLAPTHEGLDVGFRIANIVIPEPSTLLLLCFGSLAVLWRRRGLVCVSVLAAVVGFSCADRAAADTFGSGANTFDIGFVSIGNPGNAADTTGTPNPAGSVPYTYRMGQFEISEQMIDKANSDGGLGITKTIRGSDKPATQVSWNEAARFVNWLNTSSGSMPAYKFAIQPGEVGYNANANIELWTIGDAGYNPNNLYRNSLARYFLPSVDEWYKAAYYDPTSGVYYDYPTGSNSVPDGIDFAGDPLFDAVFDDGAAGDANPQPNDITNVGVLNPYGTAGQGGNVNEWEETDFDLVNGPTVSSSARGGRGGRWDNISSILLASSRFSVIPSNQVNSLGFRVASNIPEPSTLLLLCFGSLAVLWRRRGLVCVSVLAAVVSVSVADRAAAVTIDTVPVGNAGNANDPGTGGLYGGVNYAYRIGTTEVTVGQYTAFLNAVAKTDTYALYNTSMATNLNIAGILQSGVSPNHSYGVIGSPNHPVTFVSWGDAARFANWLHNGQPMGLQDATTTERGAYTLDGAVTNAALLGISRNAGAQWFIPTENEWYKAAYHQPAAYGGDADNYWNYPMRTNNVPYSDQPPGATPDNTRVGNFSQDDGIANGYDDGYAVTGSTSYSSSQNYLTDVGAYSSSPSYYGTFDQGGNVFEWNEALISGSFRGTRGSSGSFGGALYLRASSRLSSGPSLENGDVGFRVATVPEPSTLLLAALSVAGLFLRRRGLLCASILAAVVGATFADHATADTFGSGANTFNIDFVTIGNPGNAADTTGNPNPAGSVPYTYRMDKFEISEQMIDKANALGGLGITKATRGPDKPATDVTWNEAAQFVNWLNTSTGSPPAYKFALQPGDGGYSANANIQLWAPSDPGYDPNNLYRNSQARYFLPSVNEWYKAAYYDPTSGVYYDYPTGSDSAPTAVASGTVAGTAVYGQSIAARPADITLAGGLSPYGTMAQGGNVYEWEETDLDLLNGPSNSSSARGVRGGGWILDVSDRMLSSGRDFGNPGNAAGNWGFSCRKYP